jgi:hypothetical protein
LGGLGCILDGLGGVLGGLVVVLDLLVDFRASKPLRIPSFGGAKGDQDEVKMGAKTNQDGPKSMSKMKTKKHSLEDRLGAVLSRSWVVLGVVLTSCF